MLATLATATLDVKRPPAFHDGKRGVPSYVEPLRKLACTPLYAVSTGRAQELIARYHLPTSVVLYECYVLGAPDIRHGDVIEIHGADYPVRSVASWGQLGHVPTHVHVVVEKVQP